MHAVAEKRLGNVATAWHCCLEFFSVATRLPPEFRLTPGDAVLLLHGEVFERMTVHDLPQRDRLPMLQAASREGVTGGRVYDTHIADVARTIAAEVVITDNRRHFISALRFGMRVETPAEFISSMKNPKK